MLRGRPSAVGCVLGFGIAVASAVAGQGPDHVVFEEHRIDVDETLFGQSLDATNDTAVVGTRSSEIALAGGSAIVFDRAREGWERVVELLPADLDTWDFFGDERAVTIDGDTIAVSAPQQDALGDDSGSVYLFERDAGGPNAWGQVQKLVPPDGKPLGKFGSDLEIEGDTLVVGAIGQRAAYVYDRDPSNPSQWLLTAKLTASGPAPAFGAAVDIDGDRVVVGAASYSLSPVEGSAWVFERNAGGSDTWGEVAMLSTPGGPDLDSFGWSVAIEGRWLAVGAPKTDPGNRGSVYIFEEGGGPGDWAPHSQLFPFDSAFEFGYEMAMGSGRLVVGHTQSGVPKFVYAYRYVERLGGWRETFKLRREDGGSGALGRSLAVTDHEIWAGAYSSPFPAVFVFEPKRGLTLSVDGVCGDDPVVTIRRASANGSVELLTSGRQGSAPIPVGPCAGVETSLTAPKRLTSRVADANGEVSFVLDAPVADCRPLLQVLDTESCEISDFAMIDRLDTVRENKLISDVQGRYDLFGSAVDLEGNTALIGEPGAFNPGFGWIFERNGSEWTRTTELVAPKTEPLAGLGQAVSLSGNLAVLGGPGCPEYSEDPGEAWVFERDAETGSWGDVARLTASDGVARDFFGASVSADRDLVAIGAPAWTAFRGIGSAYVYGRDAGRPGAWSEIAKLEPPDGEEDDGFGVSVSLSGDLLAVGSLDDDDLGQSSGSVYLYEEDVRGQWILKAKLTASNGTRNDRFGSVVVVDGDRVAVGAPSANADGSAVGMAYVFDREAGTDVWTEVAILRPAENGLGQPGRGPSFAGSLDLDGSMLAVGESGDEGGNVYLFREIGSRWGQALRVPTPPKLSRADNFGRTVAIDRDTVLVGASSEDSAEENSGAVYPLRWARPIAELSAVDGCPGPATLSVRRATPHASLALLSGSPGASSSVPVADCEAVGLALGEPTLAGFAVADDRGRTTLRFSASAVDCRRGVQVVDLTTCTPSAPAP